MGFFGFSERANTQLYRRQVGRLGKQDLELATRWTLQLIRDNNPRWTEDQVRAYYDRLLDIRVIAVDQWSARHGEVRAI